MKHEDSLHYHKIRLLEPIHNQTNFVCTHIHYLFNICLLKVSPIYTSIFQEIFLSFPTIILCAFSLITLVLYICLSHAPWLDSPNNISWTVKIKKPFVIHL
jgi:hypothetical protein